MVIMLSILVERGANTLGFSKAVNMFFCWEGWGVISVFVFVSPCCLIGAASMEGRLYSCVVAQPAYLMLCVFMASFVVRRLVASCPVGVSSLLFGLGVWLREGRECLGERRVCFLPTHHYK